MLIKEMLILLNQILVHMHALSNLHHSKKKLLHDKFLVWCGTTIEAPFVHHGKNDFNLAVTYKYNFLNWYVYI